MLVEQLVCLDFLQLYRCSFSDPLPCRPRRAPLLFANLCEQYEKSENDVRRTESFKLSSPLLSLEPKSKPSSSSEC